MGNWSQAVSVQERLQLVHQLHLFGRLSLPSRSLGLQVTQLDLWAFPDSEPAAGGGGESHLDQVNSIIWDRQVTYLQDSCQGWAMVYCASIPLVTPEVNSALLLPDLTQMWKREKAGVSLAYWCQYNSIPGWSLPVASCRCQRETKSRHLPSTAVESSINLRAQLLL